MRRSGVCARARSRAQSVPRLAAAGAVCESLEEMINCYERARAGCANVITSSWFYVYVAFVCFRWRFVVVFFLLAVVALAVTVSCALVFAPFFLCFCVRVLLMNRAYDRQRPVGAGEAILFRHFACILS